jgi:type IV pilus assembly protein PilQ
VVVAVEASPAAPAPEAAPAAPAVAVVRVEEPAAPAPVVETPEPEVAVPSGPRVLTGIDVNRQEDGLVVTLQGNGPLKHEYFLVEGRSLVVDIAEAGNKVRPMKRKVDDSWVSQIRIGEHEQPKKFVRVVFDLKKVGEHRVDARGNRIVVSFGAPALVPAPAAPSQVAAQVVSMTALNTVGPVSCLPLDAVTRLDIRTAVKPDFTIVDSGDAAKVIVEIANATIADKDAKTLDLAALNVDVVKVSAFPYAKGDARLVRVVAQLRRPVRFAAAAEEQGLVLDFEKSAASASVAAEAAAPEAAAAPEPAAPAEAQGSAPQEFTGRRLSLDFKDADVNDILRLISEVSGLNFVSGPEVKGTVSIKLSDVPWDLALDLILKTNVPQLAQVRESENIVRITTMDKILDDEQRRRRMEEDKKKTVDAQQALEPLVTKSYMISYAKAEKIKELIMASFSSERGKTLIQYDERTNTLIVQDLAGNIAEIDQVIQALDTPTPAVLVEARIVEVDSSFGQSIGVQWNATGHKGQDTGNATPYAFPNSVTIGGQQQPSPMGPANYMVNLPAAAAAGGIGLSFGHIANTLSLDLRLSAGEAMNKIKILSNPKVLVIQNEQAIINLGQQLPMPKTDTEGNRTIEWKDVGIMLRVKPQVTNDKRVVLEIEVEKSSKGDNVITTEGTMFSVNTRRAQTKVLIADGETTVIGGIFIQESQQSEDGVPGFSKIPVLGWLFKTKTDSGAKRELMIFMTPRIVVM